jgi:AcrR family transcriptional regulator
MGKGAAPARNREATRGAILEATSQLIAEKGVDGFAMSEVAVRGRINRALIYHYFQNRDNLVFETIRFIVQRYEAMNEGSGTDALERSFRMHIEHPEISRFFFHLMLTGQAIPRLSSRLLEAIGNLEALKEQSGGKLNLDPTFAIMSTWLIQISWSFARNEIARQFGLTVEEADGRMIAQLRSTARLVSPSLPALETR